MCGTPWQPYPGDNKFTLKDIKPNVKFAKEHEVPAEDLGSEEQPRTLGFSIMKADLKEHQPTSDCPGCTALSRGKHGHHTPFCIKRVEDIFRRNNDKRIAAFDMRAARAAEKAMHSAKSANPEAYHEAVGGVGSSSGCKRATTEGPLPTPQSSAPASATASSNASATAAASSADSPEPATKQRRTMPEEEVSYEEDVSAPPAKKRHIGDLYYVKHYLTPECMSFSMLPASGSPDEFLQACEETKPQYLATQWSAWERPHLP